MLVVFFGLWVAPASILDGRGQVLEPSKPNSSRIFGVRKHAPQKCSSCNKTIVFAMFYRLRNMSHAATKRVFCIAFEAFLDMVQWLLPKIPAGLPFLLFITTLKRGGTCAAHGRQYVNASINAVGSNTPGAASSAADLAPFHVLRTYRRAAGWL